MQPEVVALFHLLAGRPAADREAHYGAHDTPAPIRREVESLLRFDGDGEASIAVRVEAAASAWTAGGPLQPGEAFAAYRVKRLIGTGGMGAVYEAEQEHPGRTVALKVLRAGAASEELTRRFTIEARALGRLQHPGIAHIYEAGTATTAAGPQPYFAMEYVRGATLLAYARERQLDVAQRLDLIARVCDAVEHAHQRGIVHRDLKPANILVDDAGQPKILDFGVARLTDIDVQVTRGTDLGQLIGTLAYMSPEQVRADPLEIDTRSDEYAIGVIACELLTGQRPYDISTDLQKAARTILEDAPTPLGAIDRRLRGDVETIVAKALDKDKARRYGSVAQLAEDIRRHLRNEPIVARPPRLAYQLGKFASRHRSIVAGIAGVIVVLIAGMAVSGWQAARARRAEQVAQREADTARAISDFLRRDLLAQASLVEQSKGGSPLTDPDPNLTVRAALDRAAAMVGGKFASRPNIEAEIRLTIGETYEDLGLVKDAARQYDDVLRLRRRTLGATHHDTMAVVSRLGVLRSRSGEYEAAVPLLLEVADYRRRTLGADHVDTLLALLDLDDARPSTAAETAALVARALPICQRIKGPTHPDTLKVQTRAAQSLEGAGDFAGAEALHRRTMAQWQASGRASDPDAAATTMALADFLTGVGRYQEAATIEAPLVERLRRRFGDTNLTTITSRVVLTGPLYFEGRFEEAEVQSRLALEAALRLFGRDSWTAWRYAQREALVLADMGRIDESQALIDEARAALIRLSRDRPVTVQLDTQLALIAIARGDHAAAEAQLAAAHATRVHVAGADSEPVLWARFYQGMAARAKGDAPRAEAFLTEAVEGRRRLNGREHPETLAALLMLAEARLDAGRTADAERDAREAEGALARVWPDNWHRFYARCVLGATLLRQGRAAEAEPLLRSGVAGLGPRRATILYLERQDLPRCQAWLTQAQQLPLLAKSGSPSRSSRQSRP